MGVLRRFVSATEETMFKEICILAALIALCAGHPSYIAQVPNGMKLPDPCNPGSAKVASGHWNLNGGGDRNPFGVDFAAEGHKWTVNLCQKDSDGDGKSNGEEVGDISCKWSVDNPTPLSAPVGQPGICEPLNSAGCKGQMFNCS